MSSRLELEICQADDLLVHEGDLSVCEFGVWKIVKSPEGRRAGLT